jgi:hypothetical protein
MAFWGRLALGNGLLYKYRAVYIRWVMQRAMNSIIAISRWNKTPYQCFKHPELLNRLLLNVRTSAVLQCYNMAGDDKDRVRTERTMNNGNSISFFVKLS